MIEIHRSDAYEPLRIATHTAGDFIIGDQRSMRAPPRRDQANPYAALIQGFDGGAQLLRDFCDHLATLPPTPYRVEDRLLQEVRSWMLHPGVYDPSFVTHQHLLIHAISDTQVLVM